MLKWKEQKKSYVVDTLAFIHGFGGRNFEYPFDESVPPKRRGGGEWAGEILNVKWVWVAVVAVGPLVLQVFDFEQEQRGK